MMTQVARIGIYSVKHMTGTNAAGKDYDFYVLSKREKNKDTDKWENKDLFVTVADLAVISALTGTAAKVLAEKAALISNAKISISNRAAADYEAADDEAADDEAADVDNMPF